jgi:hypothetical protein
VKNTKTKITPIKREFPHCYGLGYVAFIDILGFKDQILSSFKQRPGKRFKELQRIIEFNRRYMPDELRDKTPDIRILMLEKTARVYLFSDSYTICVKEGSIEGFSLIGLASHILYIWNHLIKLGFTIRGGIDYSLSYWDERTVTGPALINAYKIESEIAKTSRVVASQNFANRINELLNGQSAHDKLKELIRNYFIRDFDGHYVINPVMMSNSPEETIELKQSLEKMAAKIKAVGVKEKYTQIIFQFEQEKLENDRNPNHRVFYG